MNTSKGHEAYQVANYLIEQENKAQRILTPMRILKLVYIAHGYSLAILGRPLISDGIEAWKYGPVIPSLYDCLKTIGNNPIRSLLGSGEIAPLDEEEKGLIKNVLDAYKNLDGLQLSSLTHQKGTPWDLIWNDPSVGNDIPNSLIMEHYAGKVSQN